MDKSKLVSKAFSKKVLKEIATTNDSPMLRGILKKADLDGRLKGRQYSEVFDSLYQIQKKSYRSEYIYKNAIAKKIVLGKHKFSNISFFTEFGVGGVVADVVVVNGAAIAYEIKSEYDSFARLGHQLETYEKVFDRVYVVVPESSLESVLELVARNIGVMMLSKAYTLVEFRPAQSNLEKISSRLVFSCFRKQEYEDVILRRFGCLPDVKPAFSRQACKEKFSELDNEIIRKEFLQVLKNRQLKGEIKEKVKSLPSSLAALGIEFAQSERNVDNLVVNMQTKLY